MRSRFLFMLLLPAAAVGLIVWLANAAEPTAAQPNPAPVAPAAPVAPVAAAAAQNAGDPAEMAALQKNAEAYVQAFHAGDAKALAAFWAPDGEYTDLTGRRLRGREEIHKGFQGFLAQNKGLKVRIESESLRFLTPDVAVEEGMSFVLPPDGSPPSRARYTNIHVKKDGKWLLGSVTSAPYVPPSNYEHLRGLEWAIGNWSAEGEMGDKGDKGESEHLSVSWTDNQNFIVASFASTVNGVSVGRATQWIGWDPQAARVRSWIFDASGGFGEGAWTKEGNGWAIKTSSVLQDGKKATATIVLAPGGADALTLQIKNRTVDGSAVVPDRPQIKLKRAK
jgi:uncharacterized protein (TIGR02246 family)